MAVAPSPRLTLRNALVAALDQFKTTRDGAAFLTTMRAAVATYRAAVSVGQIEKP